ncbi:DUF6064 family protein [Saccharospirillum impatiens]|uniref:DUF6064 family protein n=1 Tax=Saccharospirillum impatiens TaxID=169438 RepID=UPI0003FDCB46|nr:DUF6064 family protein [Saccharospirillum impatiens]
MDAWFSYRLSDFILFSERVYWRLFDQVNTLAGALLPVLIALGCLMLVGVWSRHRTVQTATAFLLAALWISSAFLFLWHYYAPVNWAARYAVPFFLLEASLIALMSLTRQLTRPLMRNDPRLWLGFSLLAYALAIHPLTSLLFGRTFDSAEIVGLSPDATAIATLGILLITARPLALWLLLPIPLAVCMLSALTLYSLGTPEAWILVIVLLVILVALLTPKLNLHDGNDAVIANARDW